MSRCLDPQTPPEKAFRGSKHLLTRYLEDFGRLGFIDAVPIKEGRFPANEGRFPGNVSNFQCHNRRLGIEKKSDSGRLLLEVLAIPRVAEDEAAR